MGLLCVCASGITSARAEDNTQTIVYQKLPSLKPCGAEAAEDWQKEALKQGIASSQSIYDTHEAIVKSASNPDIGNTYQSENRRRQQKTKESIFSVDSSDSCWEQVGDKLGRAVQSAGKIITEGFKGISGVGEILKDVAIGNISIDGDDLCEAVLGVERLAAGAIVGTAKLPNLLLEAAIRRETWKARRYIYYEQWKLKRAEKLPEKITNEKFRKMRRNVGVRAPWGWPSTWDQD